MTSYGQLLSLTSIIMMTSPALYCHTVNDTNRLLKDKLVDYNKNTRPTNNQSTPTFVSFGFELVYVHDFDEVQQELSMIAVTSLNWTDELMTWNPSDYGGLKTILPESGSFWVPNFVMINSIGEWKRIGEDWQTIRFYFNGNAIYSPGKLYSSVCTVDVTYYPWDIHKCFLLFTPQGYTPDEVYIIANDMKIATTYFIENGGWAFVDSKIQINYAMLYTELYIDLVFERKPLYLIVNVILPIMFMAFLSNVVFLIPAECGERVSYSITVLLAIAVYLTIVGDNLPKLSNPMSYYSYYLLSLLVTSIFIALATICNLRIFYRAKSRPVTGIWAMIASCFEYSKSKRQLKKSRHKQTRPNANFVQRREVPFSQENVYRVGPNGDISTVYIPLQNRQPKDIKKMNKSNDASDDIKMFSWRDVSLALDKIFFVIFLIILLISSIVYAAIIATSKRKILE